MSNPQQFNPNWQPQATVETEFAMSREEFKGLNTDYWIEIAAQQCLRAQLEDMAKFMLAVDMMESTMINYVEVDKEYAPALADYKKKLENSQISSENASLLLAKFKFQELVKLVGRSKPDSEEYDV